MSFTSQLKSLLPKNTFWRNLTVVAGGAAAGQAVSILASPILSRLYTPHDFGVLAVFSALTGLGGVIGALSYQVAIPVPEKDEEAAQLSVVALACVLATSALTAVAVLLTRQHVDRWLKIDGFHKYFWCVPLGALGLGLYEIVSQWAARKKAFGVLGRTSAERSVVQVAAQLGGGVLGLGTVGLVAGQLLGQWAGSLRVVRARLSTDVASFHGISAQQLWRTAKVHRRFPFFTAPASLLNAIDSNAPPLLFAYFFGGIVTGYFALGHRLLAIPFWLIGSAAQKVFFPAAAGAHHQGRLAKETDQTFRRLLCVVLPMVSLIAVGAPQLFTVVMGAQWYEAGVFVQWLSLRTCFTLLVFPLMPLLYVLEKQSAGTIFNGVQLVVRVASIVIGSHFGDARLSVALLGASTGALWVVFLAYLLVISGNSLLACAKVFLKESVLAAALAAPVLALRILGGTNLVIVLATGLMATVAALAVVTRLKRLGLNEG